MPYDRTTFFDLVRSSLFGGELEQCQVDGMDYILATWEIDPPVDDPRHLAYALATTYHETSQTMMPIEEYGKGSGMEYGEMDPETGQTYFGRGFVQLTWRDNYAKATEKLGLVDGDDLEWFAERALDPAISAAVMFVGMEEGWFRSGQTLSRYFCATADDAYGAREIINGDKTKVPPWSNGVSIGNLIKGYHENFFSALEASWISELDAAEDLLPQPEPLPANVVTLKLEAGIVNLIVKRGAEVSITYLD